MKLRTLNLDGMFIPVPTPEIEFKILKFAGGELHIELNKNIDYSKIEKVVITQRVNSMDDFMKVLIAKDALVGKGIKEFDLIMPYIPYARQDRRFPDGSFTLDVFSKLLNTAKFDKIISFDAHSKIPKKLIRNLRNYSNIEFVNKALLDINANYGHPDLILISPDKGATEKSKIVYKELGLSLSNLIQCEKTRNEATGELTGFKVLADDLEGQPCIIVDDICDGGGTFMGIASELKKKNAGDIFLFVTHGIFSKGFVNLEKVFKKIYSTDSIGEYNWAIIKALKQFNIQL